jgi:hypothetical protein
MEQVPPDIARKLLSRDFTNLVGRVQKGGKLTRAERSMLQSMAAGAGRDPATVASYVELGAVLGVTRQTLHAWKKRKDAPKPASNGLHEVAAWREFMRRHDLKGGEQPAGDADMESALKARKLLAEVEERELRLGIRRGDFVSVASVRQSWTELVAQAASMIRRKFEQELPPILSGLDATGTFRVKLNAHLFYQTDDTPAAAHASMAAAHESLLGDSAALIDATSRRI